jgi:ribonuclease P/MRP protein subunit RPP40
MSSWRDVLSGIPQGSVLGPILFLIYINNIDDASSVIKKFADDTKVVRVVETEEDRQAFQAGLDNLEKWSMDWQMLFNVSKCHILHMGQRNQGFKYTMDGNELAKITEEKDVGVMVSTDLKPSIKCAKAAMKANQVLGQLARTVTY